MLIEVEHKEPSQVRRNHRRERMLWHDGTKYMSALGCTVCPDKVNCGGLNVDAPFYDCLVNCCGVPEQCDAICRNKPRDFAQRVREIGGFQLDNVPRVEPLPETWLPTVVPVLFDGHSREKPFVASAVCLPLYRMIGRCYGEQRHADADAVAAAYRFKQGTPLLLTGTDTDRSLERWWSLGNGRRAAIRTLHELGVKLVTTPNFSLFTDQPRWDNMYNMKRIAITHEEFLRAGVQAALHVNARTERDWEQWTKYILARSEVTHVTFEFTTGAGWVGRIEWQAKQLVKLARGVGRPLHLVLRGGGANVLSSLVEDFDKTTVLETTPYMKAIKRRRGILTDDGKIKWETALTARNMPVDELLTQNWTLVRQSYKQVFSAVSVPNSRE